jgi:hypothetical protein
VSTSPRLDRGRRAFLKAVGAGATALPAYRLLEASAVEAAPGDVQRFIGFYVPHGIAAPHFQRRPAETETTFDLRFQGSVLAPFDDAATYGKSWKDRITVIEGLDLASVVEAGTEGHKSAAAILTGSAPVAGGRPANESLDQYLAVTRGLGAATRLGSLVLGVGNTRSDSGSNISYARGGVPLPKLIDPARTFDWLFGDLVAAGDPAGRAMLDQRRRRGQSVLDFLRRDLGRLDGRLAAPERAKLDQHLQSLRELEKRLAPPAPGPAALTCQPPRAPDRAQFPKLLIDDGADPYLDRITELQIDLLAQAMACDLTRFATLFIGMTEAVHSGVAHAYVGPFDADPGVPSTWVALAEQNRRYFAHCARLLQRLDAFGILDGTLVYMSSEFGDPSIHSALNVPTVLAGGSGRIKMGRRLVLPRDCSPGHSVCPDFKLSANNKLLVSIAQSFGLETDKYGSTQDPLLSTGGLPGL